VKPISFGYGRQESPASSSPTGDSTRGGRCMSNAIFSNTRAGVPLRRSASTSFDRFSTILRGCSKPGPRPWCSRSSRMNKANEHGPAHCPPGSTARKVHLLHDATSSLRMYGAKVVTGGGVPEFRRRLSDTGLDAADALDRLP